MTSGFQRSQESVFLFRTLFECPQSSNLGQYCALFPRDFRGIVRHTSASLAFFDQVDYVRIAVIHSQSPDSFRQADLSVPIRISQSGLLMGWSAAFTQRAAGM